MEVVDLVLAGRSRGPGAAAPLSTGISTDGFFMLNCPNHDEPRVRRH
jgi:hypothetical protein